MPESADVIDQRIPPDIIAATITPAAVDFGKFISPGPTINVLVHGFVNIKDDNGLKDIAAVHYSVFTPEGKLFTTGTLSDQGIEPDIIAEDGQYYVDILMSLPSGIFGKYAIQFTAEDKEGYSSTTYTLPLNIFFSTNHAPFVSNFVAPDTIFVDTTTMSFTQVTVQVSDAEGLQDIKTVRMTINSSSGTIVQLYDDGGKVNAPQYGIPSGDTLAGDGTYSLIMPVPTKTYTNITRDFTVFAIDQSDEKSNVIIKRVRFK